MRKQDLFTQSDVLKTVGNDCKCIKGNYDFNISHKGCKTLIYQDISTWVDNERPESYEIKVKAPGFSIESTFQVNGEGITQIDTGSWGDGIYCFKVNNCGTIYTKNYINLCKLNCQLDHMVKQANLNDPKDFEQITHIQFLLDSAYLNARDNKPEKSIEFFKQAAKALSCQKCNC